MKLAQHALGFGPRTVGVLGLLMILVGAKVTHETDDETTLAALAALLAFLELDDGAVAVTFRYAAHRPSIARAGAQGAQWMCVCSWQVLPRGQF